MTRPTPIDRIVLASASPRRRRLLQWLGMPFETTAVDTPERLDTPLASDPPALASSLAREKAEAVRTAGQFDDALVLTFDTIVVLDGEVLGKPSDVDDAWRMLRALSGKTHQVVTGVALTCHADTAPRTFSVTTDVRMRELDDAAIQRWMDRGEFMGCAGAYNIEGQVAQVTDDECYQNVAGLPLCHLFAALSGLLPGLRPPCLAQEPDSPVGPCDAALGRTCGLGPRVTR